jgi:hypothetical protein
MARKKKHHKVGTNDGANLETNKWGIPDWRNPKGYGDVKHWSFNRWRWEFFRRREDLRDYFEAVAQDSYLALKQQLHECRYQPHQAGFTALVVDDAVRAFGYSGLPNPKIGEQPPEVIQPVADYHKWTGVVDCGRQPIGEVLRIGLVEDTRQKLVEAMLLSGIGNIPIQFGAASQPDLAEMRDATLSQLENCRLIALQDGQVALTFEIDKPLAEQLEMAKKTLSDLQTQKHGKPLQKRRRPQKWLGYLRVLDAREAGAYWSQIATVFFEQGLIDRRKDPSGGYREPAPQAARDLWNAANALRYNF